MTVNNEGISSDSSVEKTQVIQGQNGQVCSIECRTCRFNISSALELSIGADVGVEYARFRLTRLDSHYSDSLIFFGVGGAAGLKVAGSIGVKGLPSTEGTFATAEPYHIRDFEGRGAVLSVSVGAPVLGAAQALWFESVKILPNYLPEDWARISSGIRLEIPQWVEPRPPDLLLASLGMGYALSAGAFGGYWFVGSGQSRQDRYARKKIQEQEQNKKIKQGELQRAKHRRDYFRQQGDTTEATNRYLDRKVEEIEEELQHIDTDIESWNSVLNRPRK